MGGGGGGGGGGGDDVPPDTGESGWDIGQPAAPPGESPSSPTRPRQGGVSDMPWARLWDILGT